jgi:hypothetical protein
MNQNNYSSNGMTFYRRADERFAPPGKRNHPSPRANQPPTKEQWPTAAGNVNQPGIDFLPSAEDVAMRVYSRHGDYRSFPEEEVRHWFAAESELVAERNLVQAHGSYNRV